MKPTKSGSAGIAIKPVSSTAERTDRGLQRALNTRPMSHAPKSPSREAKKTQRADPRKK